MAKTSPLIEAWIQVEKVDHNGENVIECRDILVKGDYTPACKGSRGDYGIPMEPDYEAEMDLISATTEDGEEIELSREDEANAIAALWEALPELDCGDY